MNMLMNGIKRANPEKAQELAQPLDKLHSEILNAENSPITRDEAAALLSELFFNEKGNTSWQALIDQKIVDKAVVEQIGTENHELKLKEQFAIIASVIN